METLPWTLLVYLLLTCQVTALGVRLSGQVGVQQCGRFLTGTFPGKNYHLLQSYQTIPSIGSQPEYLKFTTKKGEKFCVNSQKARLMKEYVDSQSRGGIETPTWTLLDRQTATATPTPDQTRGVNLPTPVVETSEGIPHTNNTVSLISPSFTSGCSHSEEGCLEKRASTVISPESPERHMGQLMVFMMLIPIIAVLSLLLFAIYKGCKKSKSKGFNYNPTQTSSDEMGVPRLSHLA